ncbi:protein ORF18 [Cyprinid herpesvirus 1]|uniref:Protein ORF18 n=1 Tax=Cyprinid herpesvirus 1 TaxID=317858 RepID=K7PBC2_9VIRU|nr:protein ORF18 [Cyprinid herpesvirus 1]AFJ20324.1 protein ORF18 [Cyprinid herpesvirus 1]
MALAPLSFTREWNALLLTRVPPVHTTRRLRIPIAEWLSPAEEQRMLLESLEWLREKLPSGPFGHITSSKITSEMRVSDLFAKIPGNMDWAAFVDMSARHTSPEQYSVIFETLESVQSQLSLELFEFMSWWLARRLLMSWEATTYRNHEPAWGKLFEPYAAPQPKEPSEEHEPEEGPRKRFKPNPGNMYPDGYEGRSLGVVRSAIIIMLCAAPDCFANELGITDEDWNMTGRGIMRTPEFYLMPLIVRLSIFPVSELSFLPFSYVLRSCHAPPFMHFSLDKNWDLLGFHFWWVYNYVKDTRRLGVEMLNNSFDIVRHTKDSESYHLELWSALHSTYVYPQSSLQLNAHATLKHRLPASVFSALWRRSGRLISARDYKEQNADLWMLVNSTEPCTRGTFLDLVDPQDQRRASWQTGHSPEARSQMLWDIICLGVEAWRSDGDDAGRSRDRSRLDKLDYYFVSRFYAALEAGLKPTMACPCVGWETCTDVKTFILVLVSADVQRHPLWSFLENCERSVSRRRATCITPETARMSAEYFATMTACTAACLRFINRGNMNMLRSDVFSWSDLRKAESFSRNPLVKSLIETLEGLENMPSGGCMERTSVEGEEDEESEEEVTNPSVRGVVFTDDE